MIFTVLLLSHILGDYLFQPKIMKNGKNKLRSGAIFKGIGWHILHGLTHVFITVVIFVVLGTHFNEQLIWLTFLYGLTHVIIDISKVLLKNVKYKRHLFLFKKKMENGKYGEYDENVKGFILFTTDQVMHVIVLIYNLPRFFNFAENPIIMGKILYIKDIDIELTRSVMNYTFLILFIVIVGSHFVMRAMDAIYFRYLRKFGNDQHIGKLINEISIESDMSGFDETSTEIADNNVQNSDGKRSISAEMKTRREKYQYLYDKVSIGKYIGMIERFFITVGLVYGDITTIIAVIGIKTWVRHHELNHRAFSEYYLIGTLLSIMFTLISFYVLNGIYILVE